MIDYFTLALSHGVLIIALWRIVLRDDLDRNPEDVAEGGSFARKPLRALKDDARDA